MNYRRIVLFLSFLLGAAVICGRGILFETSGDTKEQKVYAAPDKEEQKESGKIAVVNLDEGVSSRGGRVNYAEKLSKFPGMDFEYASLEAARTGLETGRYGAYVIIPADFSQNVESINTTPQVSRLEFAVNRTYSGKGQYELLNHVRSYIDSLNNHLSYMYVENILREFHDAQDGAERVMEHDLEDMEAIERIRPQDLVTLAVPPELPAEVMPPEMLDISMYMERNSLSAESVETEYRNQVQEISAQIASLNAAGNILTERLRTLAGQTEELDLTTDENGGNITEKAEERLREELRRQAELMADKEKIGGRLENLKVRNEEVMRELAEPDGTEELPESEDHLEWILLLTEQNKEFELLLEEIERAKSLDIDGITELIKAEYVDPITANADEVKKVFQHRQEEELAAVTAYNGRLSGFSPQVDGYFLSQYIQGIKENHRSMQEALLKNNQAYVEYAQKSVVSSREYTDELNRHARESAKEAREAVEAGLSAAKETREKNHFANQKILGDFASKLAYTRLGSAEYIRVYQFIANPLSMTDRSVNQPVSGYLTGRNADVTF